MKKRILSLMLAVLMLSSASSLTACSESAADPAAEDAAQTTPDPAEIPEGDEAAAAEEEETLSEIEQRQLLPDNLPEVTFDGQEFRERRQYVQRCGSDRYSAASARFPETARGKQGRIPYPQLS